MIRSVRSNQQAALAEAIAHFLKSCTPGQIEAALGIPVQLGKILEQSRYKAVTIDRRQDNYAGFDALAWAFPSNEGSLVIDRTTLETLFERITKGYSREDWIHLNMAIRSRPVLAQAGRPADLAEGLPESDFRDRLQTIEAEVEARLDDPAYRAQLLRDMENFQGV
jgi:hypothetical protein